MKKKMNLLLRKCKSLSRQLGRSSSYSSLRSKSTRDQDHHVHHNNVISPWKKQEEDGDMTVFVGSTRKRYVISSKYLSHPLVNALIDRSNPKPGRDDEGHADNNNNVLVVKCEVVLFDHLLWMLENSDPSNLGLESLEELADLYVF